MLLVRLLLLDAAPRSCFRRKVDANVDKDHDAAGYIEGAERRIEDVADVGA